ncbi:UNVERIFIED_CONTAM: hypothetical protein FKN15_027565 [Acipenser sinensis]
MELTSSFASQRVCITDVSFCKICAAFQPRVLYSRLDRFTSAASPAGSTNRPRRWEPQSPTSSNYPRAPRRAFPALRLWCLMFIKQAQDISHLKDQMAQVLEYLAGQQAKPPALAPAPPLPPAPELTTPLPVVSWDVSEPDLAVAEEDQDAISNTASWDGSSFPQDEEGGDTQELTFKTGPSSETTLDAGLSPLPSLILALMECASKFLWVSWMAVPKPRQSVFRMQVPLPSLQPFRTCSYMVRKITAAVNEEDQPETPTTSSCSLVRDKKGDELKSGQTAAILSTDPSPSAPPRDRAVQHDQQWHSRGMDSGSTLTEFERGMVIGCIRAGKQVKDIIKAGGLPKAVALKFAADVEKGIVDAPGVAEWRCHKTIGQASEM